MATRLEIVQMAHRRLGILSTDEALTADQIDFGGDVLDALFAELPYTQGTSFAWALDATPAQFFLPLSYLLAAEPAFYEHYEVQPREPRSRAMMRLRAIAFPNDAVDRRDADEDGTITDAELAAGLRAAFY